MKYLELIKHLEHRLGYHQLPVSPCATGPKDLFESCPLHDELTKRLTRAIFRRNGCRKLSDPVNQADTDAVLAEIRLATLQEGGTDIDRFHLIEDFCFAVHEFFTADEQAELNVEVKTNNNPETAQIIHLDAYRRRRLKWRRV